MPTLITQYYAADNDRLDILYAAFKKAFANNNHDTAIQYLESFYDGLKQHIFWEEKIIFPFIESDSELINKIPTNVMRQDHLIIIKKLDKIKQSLSQKDKCLNLCAALEHILDIHNQTEESIIYPECDNFHNFDGLADVFLRMTQPIK